MLDIERGSTRSHCVENSIWQRLWTCRKTDYVMNESWLYTYCRLHKIFFILGFANNIVEGFLFFFSVCVLRDLQQLVPTSSKSNFVALCCKLTSYSCCGNFDVGRRGSAPSTGSCRSVLAHLHMPRRQTVPLYLQQNIWTTIITSIFL